MTSTDIRGLELALELGERGRGQVSPNPVVGALIVSAEASGAPDGPNRNLPRLGENGPAIIGQGWHRRYGGLHAEREALAECASRGLDSRGATMYVSLEPCSHTGRQPPCTEAIIEAGIARVVIAAEDPSEKTAGIGPAQLREAGIEVVFAEDASGEDGVARDGAASDGTASDPDGAEVAARARLANQPFRKHALTGRPLVIYKAAASLDGRVATAGGDSKWISGSESRALVHQWRAELDSIAVGIETAIADDPLLTARPADASQDVRQPLRIVIDSRARLPLDSQLLATLDQAPLLVIFGPAAPAERIEALREAGAGLHVTGLRYDRPPPEEGDPAAKVDLEAALDELGARGVTSLLLEGGSRLAGAMQAAGLIDEFRLFYAPILLGDGPSLLANEGVAAVSEAERGEVAEVRRLGEDTLIITRLRRW